MIAFFCILGHYESMEPLQIQKRISPALITYSCATRIIHAELAAENYPAETVTITVKKDGNIKVNTRSTEVAMYLKFHILDLEEAIKLELSKAAITLSPQIKIVAG